MRKVVANTTPLIALADIGQLELLKCLYGEVLIPQSVLEGNRKRTGKINGDKCTMDQKGNDKGYRQKEYV